MNSVNCFMVSPVTSTGRSIAELGTCVAGCRVSASNLIGFRIRGLSIELFDPYLPESLTVRCGGAFVFLETGCPVRRTIAERAASKRGRFCCEFPTLGCRVLDSVSGGYRNRFLSGYWHHVYSM